MDDKIKSFTPKPIVEGMNPYNRLENEFDLTHAMMDLFIDVEKGKLDHIEASVKATEIVQAYMKNIK
jgi:hypothetical protein